MSTSHSKELYNVYISWYIYIYIKDMYICLNVIPHLKKCALDIYDNKG